MFESEDFKERLRLTVAAEAGRNKMAQYQPEIVTYLQGLARANEEPLMLEERTKAAASQRGIPDAIDSATRLIKTASIYAQTDNRTLLTNADVQRAYASLFCTVWPFCK